MRGTSENAFGVLGQRFRLLLSRMNILPETACSVTLACCTLHNMLCTLESSYAKAGYGDKIQADGNI